MELNHIDYLNFFIKFFVYFSAGNTFVFIAFISIFFLVILRLGIIYFLNINTYNQKFYGVSFLFFPIENFYFFFYGLITMVIILYLYSIYKMLYKIDFFYIKILIIISYILAFIFFCGFYSNLILFDLSLNYFIIVLSFFYLISIFYYLLYSNRNLEKSFFSYLFFSFNIFFFLLFLYSIFTLSYKISKPLYIENLSQLSIYKYLFLFIFSISTIGYYIFSIKSESKFLIFPYLKHEISRILNTFMFLKNIYSNLIEFLFISERNCNVFLAIHFILFYGLRIIHFIFLFNFIFFHGDLCFNLCLLPISFLVWILRFLEYDFQLFFEGTCNYIRKVVTVTLKDEKESTCNAEIMYTSKSNLNFKITPFGYSEGFYDQGLFSLVDSWLNLGALTVSFAAYKNNLRYIKNIYLSIQVFLWFSLLFSFFINSNYITFGKITPEMLLVTIKRNFSASPVLRNPTQSFTIKKNLLKI